jgi:aryl-alcohol dehydrogenase-like predicted oxidoreductase
VRLRLDSEVVAMVQRSLGKTGLKVGEVGLGGLYTSTLGGGIKETVGILDHAIDRGVTLVDTAPAYGDSEEVLGQAFRALGRKADALLISTKLGGRPKPFDPRDAKGLLRSVDESRRLLGRDTIDILSIHEPDRPQIYDWWTDWRNPAGPVLDLLNRLKADGIVRAIGLGGTTVTELAHLVSSGLFDSVLTAFNYNALYREASDELLPAAKAKGMAVLVGSIFGQGGLGRRFDEIVQTRPIWLSRPRQSQLRALYSLLDETGLGITEISLRMVLGNRDISCALIGARTARQLEESLSAGLKGPLPGEVLSRLDEIAAMVPFRPFEEPLILPFGKEYSGPGMPNLGAAVRVGTL